MRMLLCFAGWVLAGIALPSLAAGPVASDAASLSAQFDAMRGELDHSPFGRPVRLVSQEKDHTLQGEVYARLATPFPLVEASLREARQWCEVLTLPFNIRGCGAAGHGDGLALYVAKRKDSGPEETYRIDFRFSAPELAPGSMRVLLEGDIGPLGTHDYRISLEAVPAAAGGTLLHFSYSYVYGWTSQIAMQAYLATAGANKVGFSTVDGALVGGMRGVLERNTMRYYLAIEAYLDSLRAPGPEREDARLGAWFDATERYSRQLHEMDRVEYVAMKHRDLRYPQREVSAAGS